MRIAMLSHEWPVDGHYTGGHGAHFAALSQGLSSAGHEVYVVTGERGAANWGRSGVSLLVAGDTERGPVRHVEPVARGVRMSRLASSVDPDVVYAPEYGAWAWPLARSRSQRCALVSKLATSLQQIHTIEAPTSLRQHEKPVIAAQKRLERFQTERSDLLLPVSTALHQWTSENWNVSKVASQVVANCVNEAELDAVSPSEGVEPSVVFVGRICAWKGADILIQAMEQRWAAGSKLKLRLIGREGELDGVSLDAFIDANVRPEHRDRIDRTGHLPRNEVLSAVAAAAVAAFPSRFEGFGIAALEAKYLGTPVIVTRGSGFDDFCTPDEDCISIHPGDSAGLLNAIERIEGSSDLAERLGRAAAASARRYTVAAATPVVEEALARAVAIRRGAV